MFSAAAIVSSSSTASLAQDKSSLAPQPRAVKMAQLAEIDTMEGQLIQVSAVVRHTDTAQVFTFGEKQGRELHALIPNPATDAANVGDTVVLTGFVRRFSAGDFEKDYGWFRRSDYPDVKSGDWVVVATSVRTPEGTELVPSGTISTTPPNAPKTKPRIEGQP
jgi:hypothetical protein